MATTEWEEGEWELVNDDGFVYKRKKRQRLDPTAADTSVPPPPDPAAEEKSRRERKKRALAKLRDKYQKEIDKWEILSNMSKALEEKAKHQQRQHQLHEQTTESSSEALAAGLPAPSQNSSESAARRVLDSLLLRVEAEEAVIEDISNLCDVAEAMCNLQEEHMKQSLVDLPIWAAPLELMASLCDD